MLIGSTITSREPPPDFGVTRRSICLPACSRSSAWMSGADSVEMPLIDSMTSPSLTLTFTRASGAISVGMSGSDV